MDARKTPLYEAHLRLGARMIDFSGWLMPLQYAGIVAEHTEVRTGAGIFDTCHMGRFFVSGDGATRALSGLLTADLTPMRHGQCRYGFLLNEDAGILDDLIAYRLDADRWLLVVNAGTRDKDAAWLRTHLPRAVTFTDASDETGKLDVQGPGAPGLAARVLGLDPGTLRYFHFAECRRNDGSLIVSRTGYTGEPGVEIYGSVAAIRELWEAFLAAGARPAGLGARDTLRLEAGLPLYGHELNASLTPAEAGMERYAAKAEPFIGQGALAARLAAGPATRLCGFRVAGRQSPRAGHAVVRDGEVIGQVTSGSFAPSLQCAIGFAYVRTPFAQPGARVGVDTGRNLLDAELVATPFYKSTARR